MKLSGTSLVVLNENIWRHPSSQASWFSLLQVLTSTTMRMLAFRNFFFNFALKIKSKKKIVQICYFFLILKKKLINNKSIIHKKKIYTKICTNFVTFGWFLEQFYISWVPSSQPLIRIIYTYSYLNMIDLNPYWLPLNPTNKKKTRKISKKKSIFLSS